MLRPIGVLALSLVALTATAARTAQGQSAKPSSIMSEQEAKRQDFEWGSLYTYAEGESYSSKDGLAAVAVIKPGQQIHPPHQHAEEEYVIVTEGTGVWSMNGKERPAKAGDVQYAAPWDMHGITNTGTTPLRFFVWKWNGKGVPPMAQPKK
jgi:mannose-6-phosphate isomerase-like protein (cupin superfamily)